jgi:hypothetical protein
LHFEVRETQSEVPRNPLVFGFPLSDHQSPVLQSIAITPLEPGSKINGSESTQRFRVSGGSSKTINTTGPAQITGAFGIQVQGYDQQDGANNQNGIFSIVGKIDGKEFTRFTADSIPFDQSRCLNALIDYEYYYQNNSRFMRLYRLPGNTLPNLKCAERGVLKPTLGKHNIVLVARDYSGNSSSVSFDFYFSEVQNVNVSKEEFLPWNTNYFYESENVKIQVQSGSIYQNEILKLKEILTENGVTVEFMRPQIPLQLPFLISLKSESISPHQLIAEVSSSGKPTRALSTQKNEQWLSAESKSFGRFAVVSDSERPKIVPVTFHEGIRLSAGKVRFEISDNFSGIESFRVEVDGKWILAEYEPKQKLLFFDISEIQSSIEKQHLLIKVTDGVGNVATFEAGFYKQ